MSVVPVYLALGALLLGIYVFFKPLHVRIDAPAELAQLELQDFTVHEVDPQGVRTILGGKKAYRYEDRYEVDDINLTDRSQGIRQSMYADHGVYRDGIITLSGGVRLLRADGSRFMTDRAVYDRNAATVTAPDAFVFFREGDRIRGRNLYYNLKSGDIRAEAVDGVYRIEKDTM